ncbi:uncharacterized protein G2W53_042488 [Senna tora]|uniref:Uncharacterized protein n=1 Tax=Senna tora TaxID=362788 RepID=A0A834VZJ1_9FABA|nr:uncharacterized protein G2W53_042488 [Senna tora]
MASVRTPSLFTPLLLRPKPKFFSLFPRIPFGSSKHSILVLSCSAPKAIPITEEEVLQAVAESDDRSLPCVRTYENDMARLTLVGAVDFHQALTAAAADGGEAASEHIDSGMPAMVVETVFPGPSDEHSTVSTRLFLPARKVKEKAAKLRRRLSEDMFSSSASKNILAMTFRQVVLQQLWNYDLIVFPPGAERDLEDLENPRQVPAFFTLSLSDEYLVSVLAEALCISSLQDTRRQFVDNLRGGNTRNLFNWFQKPKKIVSNDSSVIIYKLFEDEIVENARSLLDNYNSMKNSLMPVKTKPMHHWWDPSYHEKLEKIGGSDFSAWTSEYVPAYRLEIDAKRMGDAKFEGWKKTAENRWEVLLTHSQMIGLAEILDMYYEDPYTLPDKQLSCGVAAKFAKASNKKGSSLLKLLTVTFASGVFLVAITALGRLYLPHIPKGGKHVGEQNSLPSSEVHDVLEFMDATKAEEFCMSAIMKVKDGFGWPGDIKKEDGVGVWTGELPAYLRTLEAAKSNDEFDSSLSIQENVDADAKVSIQDIASYQVVFSNEGKIIGFQPLSRVAVNQWAANPLAKELYQGKKLSPGILEPGLKLSRPGQVIVLELLMSVKPDAYFALARPFR